MTSGIFSAINAAQHQVLPSKFQLKGNFDRLGVEIEVRDWPFAELRSGSDGETNRRLGKTVKASLIN